MEMRRCDMQRQKKEKKGKKNVRAVKLVIYSFELTGLIT
jgi:hypothetical protein